MTTDVRPLRPVRRLLTDTPGFWHVLVSLALTAATIVVSRVSLGGSAVLAGALLATIALAAFRWPRQVLLVVVLAPILDRFVAGRFVESGVLAYAAFFSEVLLVVVGAVIVVRSIRMGTFADAVRHPATVGLGLFVVAAVASTLLNAVPPTIAAIGLIYTLDAAVLFYLVRMAGYGHRQVRITIAVLVAVLLVGALIAVAQTVLSPTILGLTGITGRSGEGLRVGSLVRDPNIFGTLIALTLPFSVFAMTRLPTRRQRRIAIAVTFVLTLAMLLTYSRGSWLGIGVGFVLVALLLERRALLTFAVIAIVALGTAYAMPRGLLPAPPSADGTVDEPDAFNPLGSTIDRVVVISEGRDLRWMFMKNALPIIRDHPVVGVGPGRYGGAAAFNFGTPIYEEYGTDEIFPVWYQQRTVDNFWLHILVETGVLGVAALIAAILAVALPLLRAAVRARASRFVVAAGIAGGIAAVSIASTTTMLLEGNTVAYMFWFLLGLGSVTVTRIPPRPESRRLAPDEAIDEL